MKTSICITLIVGLALGISVTVWGHTEEQVSVKETSKKGEVLAKEGKYKEAIPFAEKTVALLKKAQDPDNRDLVQSLINLGDLYQRTDAFAEAESIFQQAQGVSIRSIGQNSLLTAQCYRRLGEFYLVTEKFTDAELWLEKALEVNKQHLKAGDRHTEMLIAGNYSALADLYRRLGYFRKSISMYKRILPITKKYMGRYSRDLAFGYSALAGLYKELGNYVDAERFYKDSLNIQKTLYNSVQGSRDDLQIALNNLATLYVEIGAYNEALSLLNEVLVLSEDGKVASDMAESFNNLGGVHSAMGKIYEAEAEYKKAMDLRREARLPENRSAIRTFANLGVLYLEQGQYREAEDLLLKAKNALEVQSGSKHPDVASALSNLAVLYLKIGNYAAAQSHSKQALEIHVKWLGEDHPIVAKDLMFLATVAWAKDNWDEALRQWQKALQVQHLSMHQQLFQGNEGRRRDYMATPLCQYEWDTLPLFN